MMDPALKLYFEEYVSFRTKDGKQIDGSVYIGATEFEPVDVLRGDPDAYFAEFSAWLDEIWLPEQRDRRKEILSFHVNTARYNDLCAAIGRRQVVPFVGSGMSAPSGLPTWSELLKRIRESTSVPARDLNALLQDFKFEEAAAALSNGANARLFNERIEHELRIADANAIRGAVRLLPALFPGVIITTNLDYLLELHYVRCERQFETTLAGLSLGQFRTIRSDGKGYLLKLHGDCRQVTGRVLLPDEYDSAYRNGSAVREELELLYRNNNLLFLGCSLGADRTIQLVAEVATRDTNMPKHYAFLKAPSGTQRRRARETWLTERGIYPIWYTDDHDASLTCLLAGLLEHRLRGASPGAAT